MTVSAYEDTLCAQLLDLIKQEEGGALQWIGLRGHRTKASSNAFSKAFRKTVMGSGQQALCELWSGFGEREVAGAAWLSRFRRDIAQVDD